jgi:hypothetical protein
MFKISFFCFQFVIAFFCISENRCSFFLIGSLYNDRYKIIKFKGNKEDFSNLQFGYLDEVLAKQFVNIFLKYADFLSKFRDIYESRLFKIKKNKNEFSKISIPNFIIENCCFFMFDSFKKEIEVHIVFNSKIEEKNKNIRDGIEFGNSGDKDILDFYGNLDSTKNKELLNNFLSVVFEEVKKGNSFINKFLV